MALRLSGMISGLDTDSIVKGLVDAQKLKNKKVSDKSQILEWKQDKLKELNTKLYKLYSEDLTKLRLQSSYSTKKVTSSNESLVEIKASGSAPTGAGTISNITTATSQSVISSKLGSSTTGSNTLKSLGLGTNSGSTIVITNGSKEERFVVDENTTIDDFITKCKNAGLNANFDNSQKRIFISSKLSGEENQFTIREYGAGAKESLDAIKTAIDYSSLDKEESLKVNEKLEQIRNSDTIDEENLKYLVELAQKSRTKVIESEATKEASTKAYEMANKELLASYTVTLEDYNQSEYKSKIESYLESKGFKDEELATEGIKILQKYRAVESNLKANIKVPEEGTEEEVKKQIDEYSVSALLQEYDNVVKESQVYKVTYADTYKSYYDANNNLNEIENNMKLYVEEFHKYGTSTTSSLALLGLGEITNVDSTNSNQNDMVVKAGRDAKFEMNGVTFTSSSNTVTVNGLTVTLKGATTGNESITFGVSNDTQATFDAVKNFVKNYNEILKELNTLYYADSASGYDPLSDDEKEAMTDAQIEKWETKIKDSMLRRDSSIGTVITSLKTSLTQSVEASDGKKYSLASFGIGTSSDYSEKGLLHIDGDPDDSTFASLTNKLMNALESDPDIVAEVLSKTISNLYKDIDKNIKSIPNVRSAFTFYNDKLMTNQQTEYKKKIAELDKKVTALENKYYQQFSAMETAMAKLQSQSNALAGMLGTSSN
ncbi:flagellar filament capping protein FliD [Clostridium sp. Marseille-P299]|uniref:flagellar filament capping protein FliD n=1 Tax=Clostridium sp. Marseille-P299 TaxID=1805477 RepID=UPI00082D1DFD|nr:flagellar filament capping protein FliD [Clostridium sp. Marseille-P299]